MTCAAPHPERPLICEADGTHADHLAWTPEGFVYWANEGYVPPPPKETKKRNTQAQGKFLEAAEQVAPEVRTQPGSPPEPVSRPPLSDPGELRTQQHAEARDTEAAAAFAVLPRSGTQRLAVLEAIAASEHGLSDPEIAEATGIYLYSAAPRRVELMQGGWIEDSGRRHQTDHGQEAIVWALTVEGHERLAVPEPVGDFVLRDFG